MTNEIFMVLDRLGVFDFWIYDKLMRVRDAAKPRPSAISSLRPCEDDPRSAVACLLRGKIVNLHLKICMHQYLLEIQPIDDEAFATLSEFFC